MSAVVDWIQRHKDAGSLKNGRIVPRIVCADGWSVSAQAGDGLYSIPRWEAGDWIAIELGYPSAADPRLMQYADDRDKPTDTVYGYVPVSLVDQIIEEHGGIAQ